MAIASLEQIAAWRTERIEGYTRPLIAQIVRRAEDLGLPHPPLESCSPCMVGIGLPGDSPNDLGRQFAERGIHVSIRKDNARIAPHVYNTQADIDRLFEAIRSLTGRRQA